MGFMEGQIVDRAFPISPCALYTLDSQNILWPSHVVYYNIRFQSHVESSQTLVSFSYRKQKYFLKNSKFLIVYKCK